MHDESEADREAEFRYRISDAVLGTRRWRRLSFYDDATLIEISLVGKDGAGGALWFLYGAASSAGWTAPVRRSTMPTKSVRLPVPNGD
jgi:hypothetical protein